VALPFSAGRDINQSKLRRSTFLRDEISLDSLALSSDSDCERTGSRAGTSTTDDYHGFRSDEKAWRSGDCLPARAHHAYFVRFCAARKARSGQSSMRAFPDARNGDPDLGRGDMTFPGKRSISTAAITV
jgi:hypothetical protein